MNNSGKILKNKNKMPKKLAILNKYNSGDFDLNEL